MTTASDDNLFCLHSRIRFWPQLQCNKDRLKLQNSPVARWCHTICRIPGYFLKPSSSDKVMPCFSNSASSEVWGSTKECAQCVFNSSITHVPLPPTTPKLGPAVFNYCKSSNYLFLKTSAWILKLGFRLWNNLKYLGRYKKNVCTRSHSNIFLYHVLLSY